MSDLRLHMEAYDTYIARTYWDVSVLILVGYVKKNLVSMTFSTIVMST